MMRSDRGGKEALCLHHWLWVKIWSQSNRPDEGFGHRHYGGDDKDYLNLRHRRT